MAHRNQNRREAVAKIRTIRKALKRGHCTTAIQTFNWTLYWLRDVRLKEQTFLRIFDDIERCILDSKHAWR